MSDEMSLSSEKKCEGIQKVLQYREKSEVSEKVKVTSGENKMDV